MVTASREERRVGFRRRQRGIEEDDRKVYMHIIRLEAQNIQRLSAVTIEPGPDAAAMREQRLIRRLAPVYNKALA